MHSQEVRDLFEMSRKLTDMWFGAMERQLIDLLVFAAKINISDPDTFVRYAWIRHFMYLLLVHACLAAPALQCQCQPDSQPRRRAALITVSSTAVPASQPA